MQNAWRHITRAGSWLLLFAALAWTLWFVFAGLGNIQDPLYWLNKYHTLEGGWMAAGTILTGGACARLFGAELLPLRLLNWLCVVAAIALPYCCLLTHDERRNNIHWVALTFALMGYGAFQEFSPGTLSVLLLSALWVAVSIQPSAFSSQLSVFSAVLLGLAVAVRFPNILALLFLIPIWRKRSLWCVPVAAITAGVVYLLGYWLITPASVHVAMDGGHHLLPMLSKLWTNGALLAACVAGWLGIWAIGRYAEQRLPQSWQRWGLVACGVLVGAIVVYVVSFLIKPTRWYNTELTYLISACCVALSAVTIQHSAIGNWQLIFGLATLSVATLGTDTGWLKLFPAVLCILPVAAVRLRPQMRRYLWPVLLGLTAIVMVRFSTNSIGKCDLTKTETWATVSPYRGIRIRSAENNWMEQVQKDYDSIQSTLAASHSPSAVISVGQQMHRIRALTGCQTALYNEFWSNIYDSVYTAKYRSIIQDTHPVVFCSYSPQFKTKPQYEDQHSAFENMLRAEGYTSLDRSQYKYMIYLPPQ